MEKLTFTLEELKNILTGLETEVSYCDDDKISEFEKLIEKVHKSIKYIEDEGGLHSDSYYRALAYCEDLVSKEKDPTFIMDQMEAFFQIPMINDEQYNKKNPRVIELYRKVANSRIFLRKKIKELLNSHDDKFLYQLLSRLQQDCEYFLGFGNRNIKNLWAGSINEHIEYMKAIYQNFDESEKPEWLSMYQIEKYEKEMISETAIK